MRIWIGVLAMAWGCGGATGSGDAAPVIDSGVTVDGSPSDGAPDGGSSGPLFEEHWPGTASGWPGWTVLGGVASANVVDGLAGFTPTVSSYSLARIGHALTNAVDVDATYTVRFTDIVHQGAGLYLRQNGGYLTQSATHGAGYAAFLEGFQGPRLGVWHEEDGAEIELTHQTIAALTNGTVYRVRFRVVQVDATTTSLSAKVWIDGEAEPGAWTVTATDHQANLQGVSGGVALDAWNTANPGNGLTPTQLTVDDLVIEAVH